METGVLRLNQEMPGIRRTPFVRLADARPIGETAVRGLEALQPSDSGGNIALNFVLLRGRQREQRLQIDLRKDRRGRLFNAAVRILHQKAQPLAEIERRDARQFHHRRIRPVHARKRDLLLPTLALRQIRGNRVRHLAARHSDADFDALRGLLFAADRLNRHDADAGFRSGFDLKIDHFVAGRGKRDLLLRRADQRQAAVGFHRDRRLFHRVVHGEDRHRHVRFFIRAEDARQRSQDHERLADEQRFVRRAEGVKLRRRDHHAHLPDVLRNIEVKRIFRARLKLERAVKAHHRREAVRLLFAAAQRAVAADCQQLFQDARRRVRDEIV